MGSFSDTISDLVDFLKKPICKSDSSSHTESLGRLLVILVIDVVAIFVIGMILLTLEEYNLVDTEDHAVEAMMKEYPFLVVMSLAVIVVPFFEEVIFRLYLRFSKRNITLSFLLIAIFVGAAIYESSLLGSIIFSLVPIVFVILLLSGDQFAAKMEDFWKDHFLIVFYFSAIIFGVVHITNFQSTSSNYAFLPLLVLPQIAMGIFAGYLRVRSGLLWGFALHALHNAIFMGAAYMTLDM